MSFNLNDRASVEFFICRGNLSGGDSVIVPVDANVQELLVEMVENTRTALGLDEGAALEAYEPSQEHAADARAALPLKNALASVLRAFYEQENWPTGAGALRDPAAISAYGCIIHDRHNNKLLGIRRAAQFKGVLKARLIQIIDDTLQAVPDTVFKLDSDFDLLLVEDTIFIHRVAAFELLAEIDEQVQAAAVANTQHLGEQLAFLDFEGIATYVGTHKRAARVVAALRSRTDLDQTSPTNFKRECKRSGVLVKTVDGKLCPEPGYELAFLQMLDRRRYAVNLIAGTWEQYEAGSRKQAGVRVREQATQAAPAPRPARTARARQAVVAR